MGGFAEKKEEENEVTRLLQATIADGTKQQQ
jgi:hypothetical protein